MNGQQQRPDDSFYVGAILTADEPTPRQASNSMQTAVACLNTLLADRMQHLTSDRPAEPTDLHVYRAPPPAFDHALPDEQFSRLEVSRDPQFCGAIRCVHKTTRSTQTCPCDPGKTCPCESLGYPVNHLSGRY